jgi:hypothetical protein
MSQILLKPDTDKTDKTEICNSKKYILKESTIGRGIATLGVCVLAGFSMWISNGETGIGWGILGVLLIWGN